ncbi:MAG TPA: amidohydrolase family protein [Acidimicrobiia bacterium]|nr:amidohydrolase family protein [Acidimicrobiia bacterium]
MGLTEKVVLLRPAPVSGWRGPRSPFLPEFDPFWEDSVAGLIDLIGPARVCFGSDFPHAEGLAEPLSWLDQIDDLPSDQVERIMGANMFELVPAAERVAA